MTMRSTALMLTLAAALVLPQQAFSQAQAELPKAGAEQDVNDPRAMRLSLEEAIRTAAERNLGVEVERYDFRTFGYQAKGATGIFDPLAFADVSMARSEAPVTTVIASPESERMIFNTGLTQLLPTGGTWSLGFNNRRSDSNNPFVTINPSFESDLGFNLTQPLLRNFGVDITRRNINIARNNLGISREAFRDVMTQTVLAVEMAYYDLIFARQNLEVKRQSRSLAADQERITQIRIDVGASAPLDILQPRVAIATREEEVITAEALIRNAEDRLRQLLNLAPEEWDRPIIPTDEVGYQPIPVNLEQAVATAWEKRPEMLQARLGIENTEIQRRYARNQVRPRLDLNLDYGVGGVGGDEVIRDDNGNIIAVNDGGYGDAIDQVTGFDFPGWSLGFNFGLPISNIAARSEARRAELEVDRWKTDEARLRQTIALDVRQAARDIDTLARQIAATRTAREAAERNVDAERKRYENGMTTNFNVLEVQQQLSDARSREIAALVAYNQAVADYHRAVGDLLEVRNITLEEPEQFEIPRSRYEDIGWLNYGR